MAPLFFVSFVLVAQFVLVNVVIAVLMRHLKESKDKIAATLAAKNLEKRLKLLTVAATKFMRARARKSEQPINRRRSVVELGLGGIELAQFKKFPALEKGFYEDVLRANAIFQEFLQLNTSLQRVKLKATRTSSYNLDGTSTAATHAASKRQRRHTLGGTRDLLRTSSEENIAKPRIYHSGAKL